MDTIRWGILGTGDIARQFASDLRLVEDAELLAIGSRSTESAARFGAAHGIPRQYASYEELAADADIDVVYIGTPHPYHMDNTLLCLEAGKAVLCEKPMAMNAAQTRTMMDAAREHGCFLMEAMWTAFFPAVQQARRAIREGKIGRVKMVRADFSYKAEYNPEWRLFNKELGGGALLDIGVYPIALAQMVFGQKPTSIVSSVRMAETGVDESEAMVLTYGDAGMASLSASLRVDAPQEAYIVGDTGYIKLTHAFSQPDSYVLCKGNERREYSFQRQGYGYHLEAAEVNRCLKADRRESESAPLGETLETMEVLDSLRAQWGLRYAMD